MKHMTINGIGGKVHYWISRPNNNFKGALVFTHGLTANHTMYERQVEYFKDDYVVITWDVPLHGLSIPYKEFSYEIAARDLNSILLQESIGKVCLIGMSMGGYPSQMFAYLYPEKVQCFVGIDTTPFRTEYYSRSDLWWLSKVKTMAKWFTDKTLRKSMAKSVAVTDYSYNKMIEMLKPMSKEQIIEQMDIAYGKLASEIRDIDLNCPVLILLGDKDKTGKVKQYCAEWAKKTGYPLHIIKNAAHFSNGDNAEQVNTEIEKFISSLSILINR
ncbi:alpha/beta fold hydrolase [Dorea formicigenerans]|uniref:Alpha/beta hydrolase n=1 Tax=Dorea formicigenerans TaxID=39486 RepID=A0A413VXC5_9FIRM|nr:alpha/beta hydrolase [Dorea formicigenerans]RHB38231.1 alpha/beta hydrolase [Dorea formicigenerans]